MWASAMERKGAAWYWSKHFMEMMQTPLNGALVRLLLTKTRCDKCGKECKVDYIWSEKFESEGAVSACCHSCYDFSYPDDPSYLMDEREYLSMKDKPVKLGGKINRANEEKRDIAPAMRKNGPTYPKSIGIMLPLDSGEKDFQEINRTGIYFDNTEKERPYISFAREYKGGVLTIEQVDAIFNDILPIIHQKLLYWLEFYRLLKNP